MKLLLSILLAPFFFSCSNNSLQNQNTVLSDSLSKVSNELGLVKKENETLKYRLLLTTLKSVTFKGDTVAIKDTASYNEYLTVCQLIQKEYEEKTKELFHKANFSVVFYDKADNEKLNLFQSIMKNKNYNLLKEAIIADWFDLNLKDKWSNALSSELAENLKTKFSTIDQKYDATRSDTTLANIWNVRDSRLESAWNILKERNK
jgi:hypothetical protein